MRALVLLHFTLPAGKLAGLETVRLIREPVAAALAYGLDLEEEQVGASCKLLIVAWWEMPSTPCSGPKPAHQLRCTTGVQPLIPGTVCFRIHSSCSAVPMNRYDHSSPAHHHDVVRWCSGGAGV